MAEKINLFYIKHDKLHTYLFSKFLRNNGVDLFSCDDDICSECINHTRRSYATDCLRCYEDDNFEWAYLNTPELKKIIGGKT